MSATRLIRGNLFADVLRVRHEPGDVWVYIVQRRGLPDILAMGTCPTQDQANELALKMMDEFKSSSDAAAAS
jgi:hypothetical protein